MDGYVARTDGFYDYDGNPITIDDIIAAHIKSGGQIERQTKPSKVYKKNSDGTFEIEEKVCEVVKFYKPTNR